MIHIILDSETVVLLPPLRSPVLTAFLQVRKPETQTQSNFSPLCVCGFLNHRSLNELRVLLLESHRHSRDMDKDLSREVHKAEWKVKEQKLQDDIKTLREKLLLLVRTKHRGMIGQH